MYEWTINNFGYLHNLDTLGKYFFVLLLMIMFHLLDDFRFQGLLGDLKQKDWWSKNYPDPLYKNDWKISLLLHAFSNTFMIFIPLFIFNGFSISFGMFILFIVALIVHMLTDNAKANKHSISLMEDQIIHLLTILMIWALPVILVNLSM